MGQAVLPVLFYWSRCTQNLKLPLLKADGIACAVIDLSMDGTQQVTQEQWYASIIRSFVNDFNLNINLGTWWRENEIFSPFWLGLT